MKNWTVKVVRTWLFCEIQQSAAFLQGKKSPRISMALYSVCEVKKKHIASF